jgi:hypothetical protein
MKIDTLRKMIIVEAKFNEDQRIHMSKKPVNSVRSVQQLDQPGYKPCGFWYGFGSEWLDWIDSEMPQWRGDYLYEVIVDSSNVLRISNAKEFKAFDRRFSVMLPTKSIDWRAAAKEYAGIEITPYLSQFRMVNEHLWYYGWDIASGCIWDAHAITDLRLLDSPKKAK